MYPHQAVKEAVVDDPFSPKSWDHQKKGNAAEKAGGIVPYVAMTTTTMMMRLVARSEKLIFDKQDRFVHLVAIAGEMDKRSQ